MGVCVWYTGYGTVPWPLSMLTLFFYDLLDALWRRLNIRYNHGMVHLQVLMARGETPDPEGHAFVCGACCCWYIKEQTWLCQAVPHPLPKHRMLHFVFTSPNRRRTKKVPLHRPRTGQPLDPRTDLKQPDKVLAPFLSLAFMVQPYPHLLVTRLFLFLSLSRSNPDHEALDVQML